MGCRMRYSKICRLLALSVVLALLLAVFTVTPAAAASVKLTPEEGKIGDWIEIERVGFSQPVRIYFSGDKANIGDTIDNQVRVYMYIDIDTFKVPDRLEDGSYEEDVHGGEYYVYASRIGSK